MKIVAESSISTAVAAIALIIGAVICTNPADAQPASKPSPATPVEIVAPVPVPVTGTVSGTVSVSGPVSVTGNVGLTGTSSVTVANPAANPVLIRQVTEPFQARVLGNVGNGTSSSGDIVTVPSGKLLVIEHIATNVNVSGSGVPPTDIPTAFVNDNTAFIADIIPCVRQASNALNNFFVCAQQTRMYIPAGHTFQVSVSIIGNSSITFTAFVSGYYVPAP